MTQVAASRPCLSLRGVAKSYALGAHQVPALRGVDLDVHAGEMVALTGPSGSGKTTLLNICGLIDGPDAGSHIFAGEDVRAMSASALTLVRRNHIGFVFQGFNLVPVMTAAANVEYPLLLAGVPKRESRERVAQQLEAVGLGAFGAHRPDLLSGGQRQRVAIARALIKTPSLVIADEPTASLDSATATQILDLMRDSCTRNGAAFLIATHDDRLTSRCDRVIRLADGVIQ